MFSFLMHNLPHMQQHFLQEEEEDCIVNDHLIFISKHAVYCDTH